MTVRDIAAPLYGAKFWLKLVGVMMIIYGVLAALSIVGIIVAWLPIWMGVLLFQTAKAVETAHAAEDESALIQSMSKLKTYFTITGILTLVGLVFGAITFFVGGLASLAGLQP